jgi:hypothetical protein
MLNLLIFRCTVITKKEHPAYRKRTVTGFSN